MPQRDNVGPCVQHRNSCDLLPHDSALLVIAPAVGNVLRDLSFLLPPGLRAHVADHGHGGHLVSAQRGQLVDIFARQQRHPLAQGVEKAAVKPALGQRAMIAVVGPVHVEQGADRPGAAAPLGDDRILDVARDQGLARFGQPGLAVTLHRHDVVAAQHGPEWTVGFLLHPQHAPCGAQFLAAAGNLALIEICLGGKHVERGARPVHHPRSSHGGVRSGRTCTARPIALLGSRIPRAHQRA